MKDSRYWLRNPWLIIALDEEPSVQISRNLGKILSKNMFLASTCSAPRATLKIGRSKSRKFFIFRFVIMKYTCSATAKAFHQGLGPPKGKKTCKK